MKICIVSSSDEADVMLEMLAVRCMAAESCAREGEGDMAAGDKERTAVNGEVAVGRGGSR